MKHILHKITYLKILKNYFQFSFLFLFIPFISITAQENNYGGWFLTDLLLKIRQDAASVGLSNGDVLISGGEDSVIMSDAEIYDNKNNKWRPTNPMRLPRIGHKMIKLFDGDVLALGGFETKTCEIFNQNTETWAFTDSLNDERSFGETVTLLNNGDILVVNGFNARVRISKIVNSCEIYNKKEGKWSLIDSLPFGRIGHSATKLLDGRVFIVGGNSYKNDGEIKDCIIYDPLTEKWSQAAPLNIARYDHSATLLPDGKVLVTGGINYTDPQSPWLNSCELYDPIRDTWTLVTNLLIARANHSAILCKNNLLLLTGGDVNNTTWELYNTSIFSNIVIRDYPGKQIDPLVNLLSNGNILSAGGITWNDNIDLMISPTKMCYIYNPDFVDNIDEVKLPGDFQLYQNYPNPFNPNTTISWYMPEGNIVSITIYDVLGREVKTLGNFTQSAGTQSIVWNGTNSNGENVSSGIYIYKIRLTSLENNEVFEKSAKLMMLK